MVNAIAERARTVAADAPQGSSLKVMPILGSSSEEPGYRVFEGDAAAGIRISEISHGGSVPELSVENSMDCRVYLMDGQELVGAKQNRILNTDVLVPARTKLTIPVSCVEAGRWQRISDCFAPGKAATFTVRSRKSERVYASLKTSRRHNAQQSQVWADVDTSMRLARTSSPTASLNDSYRQRQAEMNALLEELHMPDNAIGLAIFRDERFLGLDLFDKHTTLVHFWHRLVESYAIDWVMAARPTEPFVPPHDRFTTVPLKTPHKVVQFVLDRAAAGAWEEFASPGEGRDYRLADDMLTGSALLWEERVPIHVQLFMKPERADVPGL